MSHNPQLAQPHLRLLPLERLGKLIKGQTRRIGRIHIRQVYQVPHHLPARLRIRPPLTFVARELALLRRQQTCHRVPLHDDAEGFRAAKDGALVGWGEVSQGDDLVTPTWGVGVLRVSWLSQKSFFQPGTLK